MASLTRQDLRAALTWFVVLIPCVAFEAYLLLPITSGLFLLCQHLPHHNQPGMRQGEKFIHARVFTQKFSQDVMFTPYMNTSLTRRPVFTQEDMQKKKTSRRWNETGEKFIHPRVFTQKFSRDVMFTPYMNTSLARRPVFTQRGHAKAGNLEKVE